MSGSMARRHGRVLLIKVIFNTSNPGDAELRRIKSQRWQKQKGSGPLEWCKRPALTGNSMESAKLAERFRNREPEAPCSLSFGVIRYTAKRVAVNKSS